MNPLFAFRFSLRSLSERSVRSWLTVLGVIISIAVILILLTLTSSLQGAIVDLFEQFGAGRVQIFAKGGIGALGPANSLIVNDVSIVESLPYYDLVLEYLVRPATQVEYRNVQAFLPVIGMPTSKADATDASYDFSGEMQEGRFFRDGDRNVAVIGHNVAKGEYFPRDISVRSSITVNNTNFRVVGIFKQYGTNDDDQVIIPLEDLRVMFNEPFEVSIISADVKQGLDIDEVAQGTVRAFDRRKGEDTVDVLTPEALLRQFNSILGIVQGLLLAIASISMVVGALGIANTMFTSVLEREKEIGILKSIGARNRDILAIFMAESALIGLVGGIVGVVLGILIAFGIGAIATAAGFAFLTIVISPMHVLLCLVFSTLIGLVSGFLPSFLGARKRIVDTLRAF